MYLHTAATTLLETHTLLEATTALASVRAGTLGSLSHLKTRTLLDATATETGTAHASRGLLAEKLGRNVDTVGLAVLGALVVKTPVAALVYLALLAADDDAGGRRKLADLATLLRLATLALLLLAEK